VRRAFFFVAAASAEELAWIRRDCLAINERDGRRMRTGVKAGLVVGSAAALAGLAWWRWSHHQQVRRERLESGEINELTEIWTAVNGCRVFARMRASGASEHPPVVLVHGFGVSGAYFVPVAERLSHEFDVYVPDLPGHGRSDTPDAPLDIHGLAYSLLCWLDAMGLEKVVLVGNSMGCQIVADLAMRRPERVDRLVLIGPTLDQQLRTLTRALPRLLACTRHERPTLYPLLARDYLRMINRIPHEYIAMRDDRIEAKLRRIEQPVLFIRGGDDPITSAHWLAELVRITPDCRVSVIPDEGHAAQFSAPASIIRVIAPFIRENEGSRPVAMSAQIPDQAPSSWT
jgi:2-hydroxy-6-oxonona-2,4-dienedioate hydrolase